VEPEKAKITFEDAAAMVIDDYRINSRRSLDDVQRRITLHLSPVFKGRRLSAITSALVQKYIVGRLDAKAKAATINRELAALKRAFRLAEVQRPAFRMLRENNVRAGFFEPEQLASVLTHLPEPLRPVIRFAAVTGWRVQSEILPLEWRHVDWRASEVRLDPGTGKGARFRSLMRCAS
jgi:integrase